VRDIDPDPTPADIQLTGPPLVATVRNTLVPLAPSVAVTEVIDSVAHPAVVSITPLVPLGPVEPLAPLGPFELKGIHGSTTRVWPVTSPPQVPATTNAPTGIGSVAVMVPWKSFGPVVTRRPVKE
jgi:hypothetical protein